MLWAPGKTKWTRAGRQKLCKLCLTLSLTTTAAAAEPATLPLITPPQPGLTLPAGGVMAQLNLEMGMNEGTAFEPVSIAPDISYGVTDDLTLSLVHSNAAISGFRGTSGAGLCITGTDNGCPHVYQDFGAEALYSVLRGPFALAANGGLIAQDLRPASPAAFDLDLKVGRDVKVLLLFLEFLEKIVDRTEAIAVDLFDPVRRFQYFRVLNFAV